MSFQHRFSRSFRYIQIPAALLAGFAMIAPVKMLGQSTASKPVDKSSPNSMTTAPASVAANNATVVADVVARVNDQIISNADLERQQAELAQEAKQRNLSPEEAASAQKNLLRDLIDQQLLLSKGKELGINGDTQLIRRLDEIRKQNHMDSMEDLEKAAKDQGVSFEDFKANIRNGIITQQVVRDEVGRHLQMTQADLQKFYAAHQKEFDRPEGVRLSEILITTDAKADDAQVAAAKAKADDVYAKLKAGAKFDEMAKLFSGGSTAAQGGDLGQFRKGQLAQQLEDQTFVLKTGEYTAPIRTRQGFIILKVTEHNPGGIPKLEDVQQEVEEMAYTQRMQPALRRYLTRLREEAYIEIKPGLVDSGASPNETKPLYSAYTPPAPKKKKSAKERFRERGRYAKNGGKNGGDKSTATTEAAVAAPAAPAPAPAAKKTAPPANGQLASAKPKKTKREKVRFGQTPQNSLPPAPEKPESEQAAAGTTPAAAGEAATPAAAGTTEVASSSAGGDVPNPLEPQPEEKKKSRFSDRAKMPKVKKKPEAPDDAALNPASEDEIATQKVQAAPLGLNGDTTKKKKVKPTEKTRYSQTEKPKPATTTAPATDDAEPATPATTPAPAAAPATTQPQ